MVWLTARPTSYIFTRKEVPPYYAGKKLSIPLTAGTQLLYLCTQGSASISSLTAGTHLVEAYIALYVWSRTCMYILVDQSLQQ